MTGIRYADLVDGASIRIAAGARAVRLRPFDDRDEARAALRDFHAVLDALETHTWTLITPSRLAGLPATTRIEPVVAGAIAMVDGIRDVVGAERPHPSMLDLADRDWAQAALRVRGASDLVGVHHDQWGEPRSPDATIVTDPSARDSALVRVARQLDTILATESSLGLRCIQAGVHRAEVSRWLPDLAANRAPAQHLIQSSGEQLDGGRLDAVRLIGEPPRTADPVEHAEDLLLRIRQRAWELPGDPDYSVATLRDLATVGLMVTAHTAAAHGSNLTANPPTLGEDCEHLMRAAAHWRDLRADLGVYRAPGPADPTIRADVLSLRGLLERLAPLEGRTPTDPRAAVLLRSARATVGELAAAGSQVFTQLADHGHIHIHARDLAPEQIGEDADLLSARIAGTRVSAPPARWRATVERWDRAAGSSNSELGAPVTVPSRDQAFVPVLTRVPYTGGLQR
ncbi:hypothetical protein Q6346_15265 [Isoptericola sp. b490]|uniref:hypothetical protein n=1 Tax=Actinotalea lenta TaxID=3064654 RepID=UPI002712AC6D|nr:hypothetical protein [Isoptericola sp. b490]MDO8122667.1 hypothetical protein [Isoptericola sp. b490]